MSIKAARIVTLNEYRSNQGNVSLHSRASDPIPDTHSQTCSHRHQNCGAGSLGKPATPFSEAVKKAQIVPVRNDPPRIIYSANPSLLVLVDGPPALRPMPGLDVEHIINTRAADPEGWQRLLS